MTIERAQWASRMGFILAAAGSAVGLGNIWKFPYITGLNGGGLFVAIYLGCILLVGLPIMMAEIMIGRAAQTQPVGAFEVVSGRKTLWSAVGWMGVIAGFIILSYYIVVAGWAMDYTLKSVANFTAPIEEKAQIEATKYRAGTSLESMRATLAEGRATRESKNTIRELKSRAPKVAWKAHSRFRAGMSAGQGQEPEKVRENLLSNSVLRGQVEQVETINKVVKQVQESATNAGREPHLHVGAGYWW